MLTKFVDSIVLGDLVKRKRTNVKSKSPEVAQLSCKGLHSKKLVVNNFQILYRTMSTYMYSTGALFAFLLFPPFSRPTTWVQRPTPLVPSTRSRCARVPSSVSIRSASVYFALRCFLSFLPTSLDHGDRNNVLR